MPDDQLEQARAAGDHWKNVSRRLLADMDAIRRTLERVKDNTSPVVTPDDIQMVGACRVLCEVALQDHAGMSFPVIALQGDREPTSPEDRGPYV